MRDRADRVTNAGGTKINVRGLAGHLTSDDSVVNSTNSLEKATRIIAVADSIDIMISRRMQPVEKTSLYVPHPESETGRLHRAAGVGEHAFSVDAEV